MKLHALDPRPARNARRTPFRAATTSMKLHAARDAKNPNPATWTASDFGAVMRQVYRLGALEDAAALAGGLNV